MPNDQQGLLTMDNADKFKNTILARCTQVGVYIHGTMPTAWDKE